MVKNMLFLIIILLGTSGCATPTASVPITYTIDNQSKNGLLIGSVKYVGPSSGYKVYFKGIENDVSGYFEAAKGMVLIPIPPQSDFKNIKGKLQATELPAGTYEISRWHTTSGYAQLSQTKPFSIKFVIKPGAATYIGSFIFSVTNRFGLTVTGVKMDFEDRYLEDIEVLRERYPNLADIKVFMGIKKGTKEIDVGGASGLHWDSIYLPVYY